MIFVPTLCGICRCHCATLTKHSPRFHSTISSRPFSSWKSLDKPMFGWGTCTLVSLWADHHHHRHRHKVWKRTVKLRRTWRAMSGLFCSWFIVLQILWCMSGLTLKEPCLLAREKRHGVKVQLVQLEKVAHFRENTSWMAGKLVSSWISSSHLTTCHSFIMSEPRSKCSNRSTTL